MSISAIPASPDARLCAECALGKRLKVSPPCPSHSNGKYVDQSSLPNAYLYDLTLSGNKIRLLRLEPGSGNDVIRCSLVVKSLDQDIVYNALSYAWGDSSMKQTIICDKKQLKITQSLYTALWQLREDGRIQLLWADAVCINQANTAEKTAQVRMMRKIYEQATLVVAWLGKEIATDEAGFSLMRTIYKRFGDVSLEDLQSISFAQGDELRLPGVDDPVWAAFCNILYRPYFFRVWIIQEIFSSKRCIVQCGTHVVDLHVLLGIGGTVQKFHFLKIWLQRTRLSTLRITLQRWSLSIRLGICGS